MNKHQNSIDSPKSHHSSQLQDQSKGTLDETDKSANQVHIDPSLADSEKRQQMFAADVNQLWLIRQTSYTAADNLILTLSGALLGFSPSIIKDVTTPGKIIDFLLLPISWTFLILAIVLTLCSYFASRKATEKRIDMSRRYYIEHDEVALTEKNQAREITEILNTCAAITFVVGTFLTMTFATVNIYQGNRLMATQTQQSKEGVSPHNIVPIPQDSSSSPNKPKPTVSKNVTQDNMTVKQAYSSEKSNAKTRKGK